MSKVKVGEEYVSSGGHVAKIVDVLPNTVICDVARPDGTMFSNLVILPISSLQSFRKLEPVEAKDGE